MNRSGLRPRNRPRERIDARKCFAVWPRAAIAQEFITVACNEEALPSFGFALHYLRIDSRIGKKEERYLLALLLLVSAVPFQRAPAPQPQNSLSDDLNSVVEWVKQLPLGAPTSPGYGALKVHPTVAAVSSKGKQYYRVSPYIANLGVLGILRSHAPGHLGIAERWMTWFTAHLTPQSAPDGVPFEHFYLADGSGETVCVKPGDHFLCRYNDATDSAAATFFSVLQAYIQAGGKPDVLTNAARKNQMERMAATLLDLQQMDGLFWAKRDYQVKYLEDNCEVYAGLNALAELEQKVYHAPSQADRYRQAADRTRQGILKELYDPNTERYFVAKFEDGKRQAPDLGKWFPDMQSQLWPQLWGVVDAKDPRTEAVMRALNRHWNGKSGPDWAVNPEKINGGWIDADVAYAALLAGDTDHVVVYLHALERGKLAQTPDRFAWPYTAADAGWLLQILTRLSDSTPFDAHSTHTIPYHF